MSFLNRYARPCQVCHSALDIGDQVRHFPGGDVRHNAVAHPAKNCSICSAALPCRTRNTVCDTCAEQAVKGSKRR